MKLRIALKIYKAIGTPRDTAYTGWQKWTAIRRVERCKSDRLNNLYWNGLMRNMGPSGRAQVLPASMGFGLLMRTPIEQWRGESEDMAFHDYQELHGRRRLGRKMETES